MSRSQDTVIDDDEETCPLCIEEFDLSDKNFRPCPCGYQICQFCFNSLKTTYEKSTCPNCRRPYDESTIQYKIPTAEEFKLDLMNKNKKQAAAKRKETEKREVETSARRNLAGVRVKQQNLVYVIGLEPTKKDEFVLLETLRGKEFFGQYGDIEKIVVSKAKPGATNQGIGVYVTFKRKEDAATCIDAVDGSVNGDRVLRAQYGTTKYCSAFLRGETCMNKNCSFLHETGEDGHHISLQNEPSDSRHSSRPTLHSSASSAGRAITQSQPQALISSQAMARQGSRDTIDSRKGSHDASALPPTAGWANASIPIVRARRASQVASRGTPSPQSSHATPAAQKAEIAKTIEPPSAVQPEPTPTKPASKSAVKNESAAKNDIVTSPDLESPAPVKQTDLPDTFFEQIKKCLTIDPVAFIYDDSFLSEEERARIADMPPLYDLYGGAKRRMVENREAAERARLESDAKEKLEAQAMSTAEEALEEDTMAAGSLALGGEPEDNPRSMSGRGAITRPAQTRTGDQFMNLQSHIAQQPGNTQRAPGLPQPPAQNTAFELSEFERRGNQYSQAQYDQISNHQRNGSRYFSSETKPNTTNNNTGNNNTSNNRFQASQQQAFYTSGVQGPPPGLSTAGTPPVSGGGMFAHGQGFTNTGFGTSKDSNTDMLRGRSGTNVSHDISKRGGVEHLADPSILQARLHPGSTMGQSLFGGTQVNDTFSTAPNRFQSQPLDVHSRVSSLQSLHGLRSSTPKIPPGFESAVGSAIGVAVGSAVIQAKAQDKPVPVLTLAHTTAIVVPAVPTIPPAIGQQPSTPKAKLSEQSRVPQSQINSKPERKSENVIQASLPTPPITQASGPVKEVEVQKPQVPGTPHSEHQESPPPTKANTVKPVTSSLGTQGDAPATTSSASVANQGTIPPVRGLAVGASMNDNPDKGATSPADATTEVTRDTTRRPRTLRLTTSTIKQSEPAVLASPDVEKSIVLPALSQAKQAHSRQPSVSSLSRSRPSTPSVSDRFFSHDVSRAGSPRPGNIVGSAPSRIKSKNQAKKERKEKAKKTDVGESPSVVSATPATPVEDVAPIVARQKKQKKKNAVTNETASEAKAKESKAGKEVNTEERGLATQGNNPSEKVLSTNSTAEAKAEEPEAAFVPPAVRPPRPSYTIRDLCNDAARTSSDSAAIQKLLTEQVPVMAKLVGEMISTRNLSRDHPWLTNPSFNSAAYKLPSDNRKGQDYLDGNGYSRNDAFGYVYLPQKEKRALYDGHAVSVADTGDRKNDLLRRCLISPNGWVMRHLSVEESERVLELEERRSLYAEEYGELGSMNNLGVLEDDDFINLGGGIEELGRFGNRHGVCWVAGDDQRDGRDEGYDDLEDDLIANDDMSDGTDEDLGLDLIGGSGAMPGAWDPAFNRNSISDDLGSTTLPPMQGRTGTTVNLRAMDIDALHSRIREKQREVDTCRKEADKSEKAMTKKTKEIAKWRDILMKA